MPNKGQNQKPAGVDCSHKMSPIDNSTKTMIAGKVFKIKPQEYKGNAVLRANR
jgi:hypothetical protein